MKLTPFNSHGSGKRLRTILQSPSTGAAEILVAGYMLAFALPLFRIGLLTQSPTYVQMAKIAPGYFWGSALCVIALCRIYAVATQSYRGRLAATAVSAFSWCLLFSNFLLAQVWHPGVTVLAYLTLMDSWTLFRIRRTP